MLDRTYIEISNICNVQCSFCPIVERDKQIMSPEKFERILKQVAPKSKEVCLHLMGEPLAHPKFEKILAICEKENVLVQITTNGLLIKRYKDILLNSSILRQINFSLQSYTDNFPDRDLSKYLDDILSFSDESFEKKADLYINLRLWNDGDEKNQSLNEPIFVYLEKHYDIEIKRQIQVEKIKSKKLLNRLYMHFDSRFEWPDLDRDVVSEHGRCNGVLKHIGIHADGTVVPCCLDKEAQVNLGNCFDKSLDEIMTSKRFLEMKQGFENNFLVEELCQKCSFRTRFNK